jgi:hypothetical protein
MMRPSLRYAESGLVSAPPLIDFAGGFRHRDTIPAKTAGLTVSYSRWCEVVCKSKRISIYKSFPRRNRAMDMLPRVTAAAKL